MTVARDTRSRPVHTGVFLQPLRTLFLKLLLSVTQVSRTTAKLLLLTVCGDELKQNVPVLSLTGLLPGLSGAEGFGNF